MTDFTCFVLFKHLILKKKDLSDYTVHTLNEYTLVNICQYG